MIPEDITPVVLSLCSIAAEYLFSSSQIVIDQERTMSMAFSYKEASPIAVSS